MSVATDPAGLRKAAILLVQLGRGASSRILERLDEAEVELLTAEISRLGAVDADEATIAVDEFGQMARTQAVVARGGPEVARSMLEQSLGHDRAEAIMARVQAAAVHRPLQFLHRTDPLQLVSFISQEHPQVVAVVLAHMTSEKATAVLAALDPALAADVAHRIAVMERCRPEILRAVDSRLSARMSSLLQPDDHTATVGGIDPIVDIINRSDRGTERLIVEALESRDPELAELVRSRMFLFEDLVTLDDRSVQMLLRKVEPADLSVALKRVPDGVRQKVVQNLSEGAATALVEDIDLLGPVRVSQVEEAQQKIIRVIREMEESGELVVRRGNDDELIA
ncbi:flagellar motor switch protein FliG [Solicola sp. PLA-1-18]|uniref:flagellar motor switch protein FliG n=1 Tax=Solicola sp. PLA-1-18 TaxID=3380532 RepID=UPI003B8099F6